MLPEPCAIKIRPSGVTARDDGRSRAAARMSTASVTPSDVVIVRTGALTARVADAPAATTTLTGAGLGPSSPKKLAVISRLCWPDAIWGSIAMHEKLVVREL